MDNWRSNSPQGRTGIFSASQGNRKGRSSGWVLRARIWVGLPRLKELQLTVSSSEYSKLIASRGVSTVYDLKSTKANRCWRLL